MNNENSSLWETFKQLGFAFATEWLIFYLVPITISNPEFGCEFLLGFINFENSEYLIRFVCTLTFLGLIVVISLLFFTIGYYVVWLIYRLSLIRIYRKPRRVYPVEKQKFFSLYWLRGGDDVSKEIIELSFEQKNYLIFLLHIRVCNQLDNYRECKLPLENSSSSDDKVFYQDIINEICSDFVTCLSCFKLLGSELSDYFNGSDCSLIKELAEIGNRLCKWYIPLGRWDKTTTNVKLKVNLQKRKLNNRRKAQKVTDEMSKKY